MAVLANRVKMSTSTIGTGTIDLDAAETGYQSFTDGGITNGQVVSYAIEDGAAWEIGTGTYTTGTPNTLSRTVIESSLLGAPIILSGNAVVFITALSGDLQNAVNMDQGVATTDSPSFAGLTATTADINGGTIDDTVIGGSTPAAISGTTGTFSGNLTVDTTTLFVDASSNNVGIGTSSPGRPLEVNGSIRFSSGGIIEAGGAGGLNTYLAGIEGGSGYWSFATNGLERVRIDSSGNVGIGTSLPSEKLSVVGNVTITGSISKGSGSFKIDHPIKPDTHYLVHSFIEGPQADNLYRGKVDLVSGQAAVNLDAACRMTKGTFVALNGNVQCFTSNETGWCSVRGIVVGNILTIEAQDNTCTDTISWLVVGERQDPHMIDANWTDDQGRVITEPEKANDIQTQTE